MAKKNLDKVCYRDTYLKDVILRVDFAAPSQKLEKKIPAKLTKAATKRFPISDIQTVHSQEFQVSPTGLSANAREEVQHIFYGKEREKNIVIAQQHMVMANQAYSSFEDLTADFFSIFDVLSGVDQEIVANRIGLRYINVIEFPDGDPLDWSDYICESLLGVVGFNGRKSNLSRVFHVVEYNFGEIYLKCQFGIANPDYPALIKRRQFILDIDAYSAGAYEHNEIARVVADAHALIQEFFEASIKDPVRKLMGQTKNESKAK